jgi:peptide/nickel transport system permease protein
MSLIPGDPTDLLLGEFASQTERDELRAALGLNESILIQYFNFIAGLFQLDLGVSLLSGQPVSSLIAERFPATLELTLVSIFFSCLWGIPAGVFTAATKNNLLDFFSTSVGVLGMSVPGYFLGPMLIWVFAVVLGVLPVGGRGDFSHVILPSLSLALPLGAILMRITRASIQETLTQEFIKVAYSKGLNKFSLYFKHALRASLIPIITVVGLQIGTLLTGTVITETIFNWPGLGTLLFEAIQQRDYPIVQACILVIAFIYVFINFLTDLIYSFANPRIRTQ